MQVLVSLTRHVTDYEADKDTYQTRCNRVPHVRDLVKLKSFISGTMKKKTVKKPYIAVEEEAAEE